MAVRTLSVWQGLKFEGIGGTTFYSHKVFLLSGYAVFFDVN